MPEEDENEDFVSDEIDERELEQAVGGAETVIGREYYIAEYEDEYSRGRIHVNRKFDSYQSHNRRRFGG